MISSTKILVQPPFREAIRLPTVTPLGISLSYAEARARMLFYITYFDQVVPLALNFHASLPTPIVMSTEIEQQFVRKGNFFASPKAFRVQGPMDGGYLDRMAQGILADLNHKQGGFALATSPHLGRWFNGGPQDQAVLALERQLPVPHHDTPLQEILDFKVAHAKELADFRRAIGDLYWGLGGRPLDELLGRFETDVRESVEATVKAHERAGMRTYMGVLKVVFQLGAGLAGELIGHAAKLPQGFGGMMGSGASMAIQRTKFPFSSNSTPKDFQYVLKGLSAGHRRAFPDEASLDHLDIEDLHVRDSMLTTMYPERVQPPTQVHGMTMERIF